MHAEIIAIGDEIVSGQLLDTNSQWLSRRLEELGARVLYHTTVGDELPAMTAVFRQAMRRARWVIVTGGLGPTADDLTRDALADATGSPLELRPDVLDTIRRLFARRRREMPERNKLQAFFPRDSRVIPNPHGTAPGIDMTYSIPAEELSPIAHSARVFALPGVPAEMREMWSDYVAPAIRDSGGSQNTVFHQKINCFGAGESQIEAMLPDLVRRGRVPRVGITASQATISLRVTTEGPDEAACRQAAEPTIRTIEACLGELVFGRGDEDLQDAVARLLNERAASLAVAEWGTGGAVCDRLAACPMAVLRFRGGVVLQDAETFRRFAPTATSDAPHAPEDVETLAASIRRTFDADYGLAIGPFSADSSENEAPSVSIALASPDGVDHRVLPLGLHPDLRKTFAAKWALNLVRLALRGA